ncbi:MAG TPA: hypothetical protein VHS31_10840 [Tepidisphaeraceae bacterium]|jgi:hypothetical protein|nr:hypothetical protein [Tepidisphaeraceae bacterium]
MQPARFNVFQRVIRHWDSLHPYNAAQILHLAGTADVQMLTDRWNQMLTALALGPVHVEGNRYWFDHQLSSPQAIHIPENGSLDQYMSEEMNRPFAPTGGLPFRPFVIQQNGSYFAGVIYHHWVADSASIRLLLHQWFLQCFHPAKARTIPLPIARRGYWHYFGPHTSRWDLDRGFVGMFPWFSRFRRVRRIESEGVHDFDMRFTLHRFPDGAVNAIRDTARQHNVTVNDLFLAAMAQACDQFVPAMETFRRHDLAMGTIVDLRARGQSTLGDAFGVFLGFTNVFIRPHELADFDRLLQSICRQNTIHKASGVPESSMMRMAGGLVFHRWFRGRTKELMNFYRKRFPLCSGISNVNLNGSWVQEYHPDPLLDYIRVSPTGPTMPVVFTTTTLGNQLHFGLSTRDSIVTPEHALALAELFKQIILNKTQPESAGV